EEGRRGDQPQSLPAVEEGRGAGRERCRGALRKLHRDKRAKAILEVRSSRFELGKRHFLLLRSNFELRTSLPRDFQDLIRPPPSTDLLRRPFASHPDRARIE